MTNNFEELQKMLEDNLDNGCLDIDTFYRCYAEFTFLINNYANVKNDRKQALNNLKERAHLLIKYMNKLDENINMVINNIDNLQSDVIKLENATNKQYQIMNILLKIINYDGYVLRKIKTYYASDLGKVSGEVFLLGDSKYLFAIKEADDITKLINEIVDNSSKSLVVGSTFIDKKIFYNESIINKQNISFSGIDCFFKNDSLKYAVKKFLAYAFANGNDLTKMDDNTIIEEVRKLKQVRRKP